MRHGRLLATLTTGALLVAGCGSGGFTGVYNAPLPGGADLGDRPYRVTVDFEDVLDLVPQASVKVNDVAVGKVDDIQLAPDGWTAEAVLEVRGDVRLPANATAQLRQSSLLGEKYVQLDAGPPTAQRGSLTDGAHIPLARTNRYPQVEEVLGALSMLLNGGGIGQLQNITQELDRALSGKESDIRSLNQNLERFTGDLDGQRGEITRAIDGLDRLSASLVGQKGNITFALDNLAPGLKVLDEQRGQLVGMLDAMNRLSQVAVDTTNRSKDDTIANLRALSPILDRLSAAGADLPKSLQILVTFPFTDYTANAIKGDYTNMDLELDVDLSGYVRNLLAGRQQGAAPAGPQTGPAPPLPLTPGTSAPAPPPPAVVPGPLGGLLGGGR